MAFPEKKQALSRLWSGTKSLYERLKIEVKNKICNHIKSIAPCLENTLPSKFFAYSFYNTLPMLEMQRKIK